MRKASFRRSFTGLAILIMALFTISTVSTRAVSPTIQIQVVLSSAPDVFSSANWNMWQTNAMASLASGGTSIVGSSGPGQYIPLAAGATVPLGYDVVTDFNSWQGSTSLSSGYQNENGNRVTALGIATATSGGTFSLSQAAFTFHSSDPGNLFNYSAPAGTYTNYDSTHIGFTLGPDGLPGTADDVMLTSGSSSQQVWKLEIRGPGIALEADSTDGQPTYQADLDHVAVKYGITGPDNLVGTMTIGSSSGNANVTLVPTPEPTNVILFAGGGLALLSLRRQKLQQAV